MLASISYCRRIIGKLVNGRYTDCNSNAAPATVIGEICSTTANGFIRGKGTDQVFVRMHTISPETGLLFVIHTSVAAGGMVWRKLLSSVCAFLVASIFFGGSYE